VTVSYVGHNGQHGNRRLRGVEKTLKEEIVVGRSSSFLKNPLATEGA
jgi:hypothetical protein